MVSRDIIAQWRQDITTADDAGDEATAQRLRGELSTALAGKDRDHDLLRFVETCLSNALRMEQFAADADRAGDSEVAEFFRRARHESHKGAERGKVLLRQRLTGD
ncbi:hypothetical protein [Nocardia neocaledoniensis]|uniref:hypothetical protein n=1 Tax=Nocardia neocaledoniensis TaxID=236511 RepID=UPI003D7B17B4